MEAYEFFATPKNGVIVIPEIYRKRITAGVKVILLEQGPDNIEKHIVTSSRKSDMLLAPTLATNGWVFDREAANER